MSLFPPAFDYTIHFEDPFLKGEIAKDSNGALVRFGINQAFHPEVNAEFWTDAMGYDDALAIAKEVSLKSYFLKFGLDFVNEQPIGSYLYDSFFNIGPAFATRVQYCTAQVGGQTVVIDGVIGPKTLAAINACAVSKLLPALCEQRMDYYRRHSREQDMAGLERRAQAWTTLLNGDVWEGWTDEQNG